MVTRREVAQRAGTSDALISYVLNGGPRGVADGTRERILRAIDELGYRPNAVARSLRMSRTMTIGLVVPDNSNPFFAELGRALEDVAFDAGYTLLLGNAMDDPEREAAYVRSMIDRQVDGLIVAPATDSARWIAELAGTSIARVMLDRDLDVPDAAHVLVDNDGGAYAATTHLLGHGARRIACVAGPAHVSSARERAAGWRRALHDAGHRADTELVAQAPFGRAHGYHAGHRLLSMDDRPDAVFVGSDEQAVGVLRAAADLGVRVPDDLAICSFDGVEAGAFTMPTLTTMRQPFELIGRRAVGWIAEKVADPGLAPMRLRYDTTLVRRGSCGCPDRSHDEPEPPPADRPVRTAGSTTREDQEEGRQ
ncbi:LacI family DNA-binding transcriptional regulator [uncultured Jatrophihabitans sp.]|uniref:LacI family DNA-binding transcriptional regulator n=1 Tax=uncultured Jatrophihabitans sp. TaxID=1610747 RepID=UPI0035C9FC64